MKINQVVIAGFTTDQCVYTSVRMAGNFGIDTYIVYGATVTFCKKILKANFLAQNYYTRLH